MMIWTKRDIKRIALALSVTMVALFAMPVSVVFGKTIPREKYMNDRDITELVVGSDVTSIGDRAYYGCSSLESAVMSEGVKSIGESAFAMCTELDHVSIPSTVKSIEPGVFAGDTSLESLSFPRGNYNFYYVGGALYNPSGTRLISYMPGKDYTIYDMPDQVKYIDNYAFWGSENLKKVYVSPNVESITPYAFAYCSDLEYVYLPESVERIEECAFRDCKNLKLIYAEDKKIAVDETAFLNAGDVKTVSGTNLAAFNEECVVPGEAEEAQRIKQEAMAHRDGNMPASTSGTDGSSGGLQNVSDIERGRQVARNSHITSNPATGFGTADSMNTTNTANPSASGSTAGSSVNNSGTSGSSSTAPSGRSSSSSTASGNSAKSSTSSNTASGNTASGNSAGSASGTSGTSGSGPTTIINYNYYDTSPDISQQIAAYKKQLTDKLSGPYKGGYYGGTYTGNKGIKINLPANW